MQALERFDTVVAVMTEQEARACEQQIISHFQGARNELVRFYEGRGWHVLGYSSFWGWAELIGSKVSGVNPRYLYEYVKASFAARELSDISESSRIGVTHLSPLSKFVSLPDTRSNGGSPTVNGEAIRAAWNEANARTDGKPTAKVVEQVVREMRGEVHAPEEDELDPPMELEQVADQFPHELTPTDKALLSNSTPAAPRVNAGLFTSATPEWYTPKHVVDRVIRVFDGYISLDPCSNSSDPEAANVPALDYWTQADDGLLQPWHGSVYMNPPYGDVIGGWVERMCGAYESGEIDAAIALLPGRIDTAWFQLLNRYPICCVRGRLRFSGSENSAPFPSVVVYLGRDINAFIAQFRDIGPIRPAVVEAA